MRKAARLLLSQSLCVFAFGQTPAAPSGDSTAWIEKAQSLPELLKATNGLSAEPLPQDKAAQPTACANSEVRMPESADPKDFLHVPCMAPQLFNLSAQNQLPTTSLPHANHPRGKSIPIPTRWPNAKPIPIPGTWPNLKMLPITEDNSSRTPAK